VGVAANAGSGRGAGRRAVGALAEALGAEGVECRVGWSADDRGGLVAEAKADPACRCLVAAGGDGTVSALINDRPSVPIAVLPTGTENLFARHFRVDRRPERLARAIVAGRVARLDLGTAAGRTVLPDGRGSASTPTWSPGITRPARPSPAGPGRPAGPLTSSR
jgi:diacylglycerol kinase family enzyme